MGHGAWEWKPKWIGPLRVAVPRNFRTNIPRPPHPIAPYFPLSLIAHTLSLSQEHRFASHHISQTFCTWFNVTPRRKPHPQKSRTSLSASTSQLPFEPASICCVANFPAANGVTICHCYSRCFSWPTLKIEVLFGFYWEGPQMCIIRRSL